MKITKEETITRAVVVDIMCDRCGESMLDTCGYEGIVAYGITFGYGSRYFGDMTRIELSVCEKCLFDWTKTFKHDVLIQDNVWNEPEDLENETPSE